jgi:hypothetical protein
MACWSVSGTDMMTKAMDVKLKVRPLQKDGA